MNDRYITSIRVLVAQLIVVIACTRCTPTEAFLFSIRCLATSDERCGFLGFGFKMHTGTRGQPDACTDSCSFFPLFSPSLSCGGCVIPSQVSYNVYLDLPSVPVSDRFYFNQARSRIESVVTADLPDISSSLLRKNDVMTREGCNFPDVVDDLYICAFYVNNGNNGVAGFASPFVPRPSGGRQMIAGTMGFNTFYLQWLKDNNNFSDVVSEL